MAQAFSTVNATASALQYNIAVYYDSLLLEQAKQKLVFYNLVDKKPLPKNQGNIMKWIRYTLPGATNLLTEGTAPTPLALSSVNVTATLKQLGGSTTTSDVLTMTAVDNQVESAIEQLSYSAALTLDTYIRNAAVGVTGILSSNEANEHNTSVLTNNGSLNFMFGDSTVVAGTTGTALSALTATLLKMTPTMMFAATSQLKRLNAPVFDDGFYHGVMHPIVEQQVLTDATAVVSFAAWNNSNTDMGREKMERGYIGNIGGIRWWRSTNTWFSTSGTATPGTVSAHYSVVLGKGAVGVVDIDGGVKTYVVQGADSNNPMAQWATVSWKITTSVAVLNPSFGMVVVTGA